MHSLFIIGSRLILSLTIFIPSIFGMTNAHGGSGLSATRVIVPAGERSGSVALTNNSEKTLTYRISLIDMGYDSRGAFKVLQPDEQPEAHRSARSVTRFSPRQFRLPPGGTQVVRVLAKRRAMETGEYRSHLLFKMLPELNENSLLNAQSGEFKVNASMTMNFSIPVIIRHKQTDADVTLRKASIDLSKKRLHLNLGVSGNRSPYGDFSVQLINGRHVKTIAQLNGYPLYYPYSDRNIYLNLSDSITRNDLKTNSKIRVIYKNQSIDASIENWMDETITPTVL